MYNLTVYKSLNLFYSVLNYQRKKTQKISFEYYLY